MASGPRQIEKGRPTVAGNNAQGPKPVYMDLRNAESKSLMGVFPHPHLPAMPPKIPNQFEHIHQNAYVPVRNTQYPFAATHSTTDTTPHKPDDPTFHTLEGCSSSYNYKNSTGHQIKTLIHVVRLLSAALNAYQDSARNTSEILYAECATLLEIGRTLHGNRKEVPVYVDTFTHSLKSILDVACSNTANTASIALVLKTVTEELDKVGLGHATAVDAKFMLDAGGRLIGAEGPLGIA